MIKLVATMKLSPAALQRAKKTLRGVPKRFPQHRAHLGILEGGGSEAKVDYKGKPTTATVVEVASYHEFNSRSWLRTWFDSNLDKLKAEMLVSMRSQWEGRKDSVEAQVKLWRDSLRSWIEKQEGKLKALSPRTIEEKKKAGLPHPDYPLLAISQLVKSIDVNLDGTIL